MQGQGTLELDRKGFLAELLLPEVVRGRTCQKTLAQIHQQALKNNLAVNITKVLELGSLELEQKQLKVYSSKV